MKNAILRCLKKFETLPFLFVGSGLSIRYLGLENWEGLLRKFAQLANNSEFAYELYLQQAKIANYKEGVLPLPKVAELIENDFNQRWFKDDEFRESREQYKEIMTKQPDIMTNGKDSDKTNLRRIIKIFDWLKYHNKAKELRT